MHFQQMHHDIKQQQVLGSRPHVLHVSALVFSDFLSTIQRRTTKEFSVNEIYDTAAVTPPFMKTVQAEKSCMRLFLLHSNVSAWTDLQAVSVEQLTGAAPEQPEVKLSHGGFWQIWDRVNISLPSGGRQRRIIWTHCFYYTWFMIVGWWTCDHMTAS